MTEPTERPSLWDRPLRRRTALAGFGAGVLAYATGCDTNERPAPIDDCGDTEADIERHEASPETELASYNWHIPGVERKQGGQLTVSPAESDGVPMNVYGARLGVEGDFALGADVTLDAGGEFSLHAKEGVTLSYDGFVQSPSGVRVTLTETGGEVVFWRNEHHKPTVRPFTLVDRNRQKQLIIQRQNGRVSVHVGDQAVGDDFDDVFASGEVWLGLGAKEKPAHVSSLTARKLSGGTVEVVDTTSLEVEPCADGLAGRIERKIAGAKEFGFGTATKLAPIAADRRFASLLAGEFDNFTTENAGKMRFVQPAPGRFEFGELDALMDFAGRHKKDIWLHTMVWHNELPDWAKELPADRAQQVMVNHIKTVMGHTKGRVKGVDVINEPLANYSGQMRQSPWLTGMGKEYIPIALQAAHEADPQAELWINEYGWDKANTADEERFQALLAIATDVKSRGIRLDGIGLQAHVLESPRDRANLEVLERRVNELAAIGVKVRISEMDVTANAGRTEQAKQFGDMLRLAIRHPNISGYTMWGIGGPYVHNANLTNPTFKTRTAWDEKLQPTQIYTALQQAAA
jgi:endo-1,4-beta-xylanase